MEYLICRALGKTPGELNVLSKKGLLTPEQKMFLIAGLEWEIDLTKDRGPLLFF